MREGRKGGRVGGRKDGRRKDFVKGVRIRGNWHLALGAGNEGVERIV